jgi:hypothetical protein
MLIRLKKGNKCVGDTILSIESQGEEVITLIDLAYYINILACNELKIIKENKNLKIEKHFWYENVINKAITDAKQNTNWYLCPDEYFVQLEKFPYFCKNIAKFIKSKKVTINDSASK